MIDELKIIIKSENIKISKNRGKHVSSKIDDDALLRRVKYLTKRDLIYLATIRGLVFDESSLESILDTLFKDIHKKSQTKIMKICINTIIKKSNQINR